jgi:6-phosphogluconolactonase
MKHRILIVTVALAVFVAVASSHNTIVLANDTNVPVYLGTYTGGQDGAKGIYLTYLNTQDGRLSEPQLVAEVPNPAFLAHHPTLPRLYAVTEHGRGDGSPVHAFAIDPESHALTKLNEQSVPVQGACHLGVFPLPPPRPAWDATTTEPNYAVMVAYYGGGAVASLPLAPDGQLAPWVTIHKHTGNGPTPRQTRAHAHAVYQTWMPGVVAVPDLGADKLFFYRSFSDGRIAPYGEVPYGDLTLPPGSGPRHAAFSGKTAFVLNELNATICVVSIVGANTDPRAMQITQTISTLPEGKTVENNTTAAIFLHPNGRFLYTSNRGDDSIALFHFDAQTQRLTFVETTPCGGKMPRSFDLSPCGKWLIVAAMQSDLVTTFRIDSGTGRLTPTGHSISVKQCACVLPIVMENSR